MRKILLILLMILPIICVARDDWYDPPIIIKPGYTQLSDTFAVGEIHLRVATDRNIPTQWGIVYNYTDSLNMSGFIVKMPVRGKFDDIIAPRPVLEHYSIINGYRNDWWSIELEGMNIDGDFNSLILSFTRGTFAIYGGSTNSEEYFAQRDMAPEVKNFGIYASQPLKCQRLKVKSNDDAYRKFEYDYSLLYIIIEESEDPLEGFWEYMDRKTSPDKATIGGRYKLATIKNGDQYDIVYVDGAEINPGLWQPMHVKGYLKPTIFEGNYDMEWYTADRKLLKGDCNAQLSDDHAILTLRFPEIGAEIRLRKLSLRRE